MIRSEGDGRGHWCRRITSDGGGLKGWCCKAEMQCHAQPQQGSASSDYNFAALGGVCRYGVGGAEGVLLNPGWRFGFGQRKLQALVTPDCTPRKEYVLDAHLRPC